MPFLQHAFELFEPRCEIVGGRTRQVHVREVTSHRSILSNPHASQDMKQTLKRLGVIGPRHYRHLLEQQQKAEARHAKLVEELDRARASAKAYQSKIDEGEKALRTQQADAAHHLRRIEKLTAEIDRLRTESRQKLETVKRDLTVAREVLMGVDVKLDILEGAANVLDLRTRSVAARRDASTESAV